MAHCGIAQTISVWDPLFIEAISKWKFAFTAESKISLPIRFHIWCFKRLTSREFRGKSSGDLVNARRLRFEVINLLLVGKRSETARGEKILHRGVGARVVAVGYGFLVISSMFRHLFIDLLEYG
ncbi:hypothetical protein H5410_005306, partial [Solanum commersonii]